MKKGLFICALLLTLSLSACSNEVSQEKYNALVTEKEELQDQYDKLSKYRDELEAKTNEEDTLYPTVWAKTAFGDDCISLMDNSKYMQCIVPGNYTSSVDSISTIWKNFKRANSLLNTKAIEGMPYEKIGIKYLAEDGTALIEFIVTKKDNGYELDSISGDLTKTDDLNSAIVAISQ